MRSSPSPAILIYPLLASALLLGPGKAYGQQTQGATEQSLAAILEPIRKKHDLPALTAALVDHQGPMAVAAVGFRKRGNDTAVTSSDKFHLGSDTKAMTATLIARFIEKGELKWDDTLGKVFPGLAPKMTPDIRKITLEELLTHHAGLPPNLPGGWWEIRRNIGLRRQRQFVLRQIVSLKLDSEPGTEFDYSNLGYVLAGHMAERVGKADWEKLLKEKVFAPLGMKTAGFGPMATPGKIDQPWGHDQEGKPIPSDPDADNPPVMGPAGRVHCSLPDWSRFVALHLRAGKGEPALLRPGTFEKLHASPYKNSDYTRGGWIRIPYGPPARGPVLLHDGSNTMNYASAWLAPEREFAVLVATNQGGEEAHTACVEARRQLIEKYLPPK